MLDVPGSEGSHFSWRNGEKQYNYQVCLCFNSAVEKLSCSINLSDSFGQEIIMFILLTFIFLIVKGQARRYCFTDGNVHGSIENKVGVCLKYMFFSH